MLKKRHFVKNAFTGAVCVDVKLTHAWLLTQNYYELTSLKVYAGHVLLNRCKVTFSSLYMLTLLLRSGRLTTENKRMTCCWRVDLVNMVDFFVPLSSSALFNPHVYLFTKELQTSCPQWTLSVILGEHAPQFWTEYFLGRLHWRIIK